MATIYDVAKAAGVSPKTVSRVLNGDAPVNERTRKAVQKAINDLGYVPSSAARAMRSNRSGLIGLITGAISVSPQIIENGLPDLLIVQGIQRVIEGAGKTLLISDTGGRTERVATLMRTFREHRVEGLIYVADHHQQVSLPPLSTTTKLVLANCYDDKDTPSVLPNDYQGQKLLVAELIAKGHRRIAYLTFDEQMDATQLRSLGYRDALGDANIDYDPALVISADPNSPETEAQLLWDAIDRLMTLETPPSVICCANDRMAMLAYGILRSRGLSLPGDISVAGYDNHRLISETLFPPLTTVELAYGAIGARAAQLLLALINDESVPQPNPQLVGGPVIWRESVMDIPTPVTNLSILGRNTK